MKKNRTTGEKKIQTGLRVPQSRYDEVKDISQRTGLSINSIMVMLMDIGLESYKLKVK